MRNLWARVIKGSTRLTPTEKLVWLEINHLSARDEGCTLSDKGVAVRLGVARETVWRVRRRLLRLSLLIRKGPKHGPWAWYTTMDDTHVPNDHNEPIEVFKGYSEILDGYVDMLSPKGVISRHKGSDE